MPRYIEEYPISIQGAKLTVPTCARFLGVEKNGNQFVLIAEIWGNPSAQHIIDVKVFHKASYIHPNAVYIGHVLAGSLIYHFAYTYDGLEDRGSDGGMPGAVRGPEVPAYKPWYSGIAESIAGGMKEC